MNPKTEELDKLPGMDELIGKLRREGFYDQDPTKYQSIHAIRNPAGLQHGRLQMREVQKDFDRSV